MKMFLSMRQALVLVVLLATLSMATVVVATEGLSSELIADEGLRLATQDALIKEGLPLTREGLTNLTVLDASERGIRDLNGLQVAISTF